MSDQVIRVRCGNFLVLASMAKLASSPFGVELSPIHVRDAAEIERAVAAFARESNGGLIVTASSATAVLQCEGYNSGFEWFQVNVCIRRRCRIEQHSDPVYARRNLLTCRSSTK